MHDHNYVSKPIQKPSQTPHIMGKIKIREPLVDLTTIHHQDNVKNSRYRVRCGILRSSDIVYGIRVQKLKRRKKYMRKERVKLHSFGPLTERQAQAAVMALDTCIIKRRKGKCTKKKHSYTSREQYQTIFERIINSRQENEMCKD